MQAQRGNPSVSKSVGTGLLQPCNVRLLTLPKLLDPVNALQFLLLVEWYESGREFWPLVCDTIFSSKKVLNYQAMPSPYEGTECPLLAVVADARPANVSFASNC